MASFASWEMGAWLFVLPVLCGCMHSERGQLRAAELITNRLAIHPGQRVADIGAGDGVVAFRLAEAVGPAGKVYAVEIDPAKLERLRARAGGAAHRNVEVVRASEGDANLPEGVDVIVLRRVYHHLRDRVGYFSRLARHLRPAGRVAIIELDRVPWYYFHGAHRTDAATVKAELEAAGFALAAEHRVFEHESFLVFVARPPRAPGGA